MNNLTRMELHPLKVRRKKKKWRLKVTRSPIGGKAEVGLRGEDSGRSGRQFDQGLVIGTKYQCNSTQFGLDFNLENSFL